MLPSFSWYSIDINIIFLPFMIENFIVRPAAVISMHADVVDLDNTVHMHVR